MRAMKRIANILSVLITLILGLTPVAVHADIPVGPSGAPPVAPVLITEVQAGSSSSASEEFIELYNTTPGTISFDEHTWQLEIASSTAANWDSPLRTIVLGGSLGSGQYMVVASQFTSSGQTTPYLPAVASQWFSAGISASAGHIRLTYQTNQPQSDGTCSASETVVDEVEWSTPKVGGGVVTPSIDGRSPFVTSRSVGIPAGLTLQRYVDPVLHVYIDTDVDMGDFTVSALASPGQANVNTYNVSPAASLWQAAVPLPADGCSLAPPLTGGAGSTLVPPPDSPPATIADSSEVTASQSADVPSLKQPAIPAADEGLLGPQLSELLPNPAPPATDAADEFIELYNPNDVPFDLSDFILAVGLTTTHTYHFPAGTLLPPKSFTAFFSSVTGLNLSNSGGQASLLDPLGNTIVKSDAYGTAKEGQAWILANGMWQWTIAPTPNAENIVRPPTPTPKAAAKSQAVKAATTTAAKKTNTKKASSKAPAKSASTSTPAATAADAKQGSTGALHPVILAGVAGVALLYGAYEYRSDVANYFRRRLDHRAARRAARQEAAGRGGD